MEKYYYLIILVSCDAGPALVVFLNKKLLHNKKIRYLYPSVMISAVPFILWDMFATWRGHWSFNPKYILGVYISNLPVEEFLFFMIIPQGCILLYAGLKKHEDTKLLFHKILGKLNFGKNK